MAGQGLKVVVYIEWCYLRRFPPYFRHITATAHIIHVFTCFYQYLAGALNCLAQGHSHEKTRRIPG